MAEVLGMLQWRINVLGKLGLSLKDKQELSRQKRWGGNGKNNLSRINREMSKYREFS